MLTLNEQLELISKEACEYLGCPNEFIIIGKKASRGRGKNSTRREVYARRVFILVCTKIAIPTEVTQDFMKSDRRIYFHHLNIASSHYKLYGDMKRDTDAVMRRVMEAAGGRMVV